MSKSFEDVMKTKQPEFKTLPHFTKAIEGRTVTTLFSVAGNIDSYGDRIWPGAFAQTFAQRGLKVLHLWQHDFLSPPIAVVKALQEIPREALPEEVLAEFPEALGGAEAVSDFLETERGEEVLTALKSGSPLEASFGYDAIKVDFEEVNGERIRNLREVRLWELSTCLWGANSATLGSKLHIPLDQLLKHLEFHIGNVASGARHSSADVKLLNTIHRAAVDLGCDECKGILEAEAETEKTIVPVINLARLHAGLRMLELGAH